MSKFYPSSYNISSLKDILRTKDIKLHNFYNLSFCGWYTAHIILKETKWKKRKTKIVNFIKLEIKYFYFKIRRLKLYILNNKKTKYL